MNRNRKRINGQNELNRVRNLTKNKPNLMQKSTQNSKSEPKELRTVSCSFLLFLFLILVLILIGLYVKIK